MLDLHLILFQLAEALVWRPLRCLSPCFYQVRWVSAESLDSRASHACWFFDELLHLEEVLVEAGLDFLLRGLRLVHDLVDPLRVHRHGAPLVVLPVQHVLLLGVVPAVPGVLVRVENGLSVVCGSPSRAQLVLLNLVLHEAFVVLEQDGSHVERAHVLLRAAEAGIALGEKVLIGVSPLPKHHDILAEHVQLA